METTLKVICEKAFVAKETNNLNLIGIFENIYADTFPARHPEFFAVFSITVDPKEGLRYTYHFDVTNASGEQILDTRSQPQEFTISVNGKANLILGVRDIAFPKEGLYDFNLYIGDNFKETIPIRVMPRET